MTNRVSYRDTWDAAVERQQAAAGRELTGHEVQRLGVDVFIDFLHAGRVDELSAALHEGEEPRQMVSSFDLIRWVRMELEEAGRAEAIDDLYRPLVRGRIRSFWKAWRNAEAGDWGGMARAAEDKGEAMRLLDDWLNAMHRLGKTAQRDRLLQEVRKLHANERAPLPPLSEQPMTGERFWALLEAASSGAADMAGFLDALEQGLLACTGEALVAFQKHLQTAVAQLASHDLWALAYLARGGCSDDAFDYFRAWIVAQGREVFEAALRGPEDLLGAVALEGNLQCEELMYAAGEAYERRTGKPMPGVRGPRTVWTGRKWREDKLEQSHAGLLALLEAQRVQRTAPSRG
ncbi:MAG: DUF4240 domain-containing protein [Betaproteobacteria bacterium]|jgi:hypothetical protein|nr:DUF4240 domain-containing protein [Rhodocyclaceae bacterium]MCA3135791.1 DUF4240 domain-containing protein [Rhodocyclaceae bacterium]MCA3141365.1 DUF4240 domain-containing protein [Rhodocyclaceae bacterium]MCA3146662.1 DUF4240 domain-containing protein [Rhodocyclaceae bacterium]MCE2896442.1 DUF4240 domain-containing protein [Betaproteobacteria bacterium]